MSKSPRRKAIKDFRFEQRKLYRRRLQYDDEIRAARASFELAKADFVGQLRYLRNEFAPRLAKLAGVTVGVPFQVAIPLDPPPIDYFRPVTGAEIVQPMYRVERINTDRRYAIVVQIADELTVWSMRGVEETAIREMSEHVRYVVETAIRREIFGGEKVFRNGVEDGR